MGDEPFACERCGLTFDGREADQEAWDRFDMLVCPKCVDDDAPAFLCR
jgi:hypothetical protein